jgi:hypothetical protein
MVRRAAIAGFNVSASGRVSTGVAVSDDGTSYVSDYGNGNSVTSSHEARSPGCPDLRRQGIRTIFPAM